ncbi:MAG: dephospho-CoA kinase [Pseudomonadota bacterium]
MLKVALTGGIASGKTAVSDRFAALGIPVIDTDVIAREVVAPGTPGLAQVIAIFGEEVRRDDGSLARDRLRARVFADDAARRQLEGLLHPLIWQTTLERVKALDAPYCLLVIPLLAEGSRRDQFDRVLVVDCAPETQLRRLMARDHEDEDQARRILAAQASRETRLALADDVLVNDGDLTALDAQVAALHARYLRLAD